MKTHVRVTCGTRVSFSIDGFQGNCKLELTLSFHTKGQSFPIRLRNQRWKVETSQSWLCWAAKRSPGSCGVSGYSHAAELSNPCSAQKGWYQWSALQPFGVLSSSLQAHGSVPAPPSSAPGPALPAPRPRPDAGWTPAGKAGRPWFARCCGREIQALPGGGSLQQSRSQQRRRRKASPAPSLPDPWADAVSFPTSASSPTGR